MEITNQLYSGKIHFSGSIEQLKEYLYDKGFIIKRNGKKFYLTKND